jgi:hypothetical protein
MVERIAMDLVVRVLSFSYARWTRMLTPARAMCRTLQSCGGPTREPQHCGATLNGLSCGYPLCPASRWVATCDVPSVWPAWWWPLMHSLRVLMAYSAGGSSATRLARCRQSWLRWGVERCVMSETDAPRKHVACIEYVTCRILSIPMSIICRE